MQFPIIIEKDEDGFYAKCTSLPGCFSQGSTYEETIKNIKDAISLYVKDCVEDKEIVIVNQDISFQMVDIPLDDGMIEHDKKAS